MNKLPPSASPPAHENLINNTRVVQKNIFASFQWKWFLKSGCTAVLQYPMEPTYNSIRLRSQQHHLRFLTLSVRLASERSPDTPLKELFNYTSSAWPGRSSIIFFVFISQTCWYTFQVISRATKINLHDTRYENRFSGLISVSSYIFASDVYEINHMNCGNEIKWRLILAVMNAIICNCVKKPEKNSRLQRGLNPWPRDTGATL